MNTSKLCLFGREGRRGGSGDGAAVSRVGGGGGVGTIARVGRGDGGGSHGGGLWCSAWCSVVMVVAWCGDGGGATGHGLISRWGGG